MAYDHKKSIRKLTDKQFSRDTAIDASDIDSALEDSVERFNKIPVGDRSTRMTPTQFVFGYTPAPIASQPMFDKTGATTYIVPNAASGRSQNTWAPWLPIVNNKYTSVSIDHEADPAAAGGYQARYSNTFTPTEGFQNKWRIKGTKAETTVGMSAPNVGHEFIHLGGNTYWGGTIDYTFGRTGEGYDQYPRNGYQHAWTNSWQFNRPCIIDDISIMLRTDDSPGGLFDIDWSYDYLTQTYGAHDFFVVLHVDSPVASEDRAANDVEGHFGNTDIYISRVSRGKTPSAVFSYSEMEPLVPGYAVGQGLGLNGRVVRWRDMNIPIHQGARVRLSLVVPVHAPLGAIPDQYAGGWSRLSLARHLFIPTDSWTQAIVWGPNTLPPPLRYLAMHNFSMSGVLTVLEEVQG